MEVEEGLVGIAISKRCQRRQRRRVRAGSGVHPRLGERHQQGIDTLPLNLADSFQRLFVVAVARIPQRENELRQTSACLDVEEALGQRGRVLDPTVGDQQGHGAAQERGIVRILDQHALEVLGCRSIVTAGMSVAADKIVAERRGLLPVSAGRGLRRHGRRRRIGRRETGDA